MRNWIARILAPQMARDASAYNKMWHNLDDARWWLAKEAPEAASMAQYILERDAWYWGKQIRDDMDFCPPKWVIGIDSFRHWITSSRVK